MDKLKVAKGDMFNKLIVSLYIAGLTPEEKRTFLKFIENGMDPRDLPFWKDVGGLYPRPKLTPTTGEIVEKMLKEQINAERKIL